ncbi:MAG: virulence RhuM family protein [Dysgonamonadaceae bacterium]|nr:virulence RhuM family protein [Dysgonamonadaceae bacterium]
MDNKKEISLYQPDNTGEIVLYQPDNSLRLEVRMENETVWLSQSQMSELFQTTRNNVTMHISNIFKEGELEKNMVCKDFLHTTHHGAIAGKTQERIIKLYNLDVIISVGYRIKSLQGTLFRIWATRVIKDYLLKGYAINQRIERVEKFALETEKRVTETEKKIDFFVKTSLPPAEGIFYDGQIFDAYAFTSNLIKSAKKSITLIDNYVDESILVLLSKRVDGVSATIYTAQITPQFQLDIQRYNAQYQPVIVRTFTRSHDRFLFIDDDVYHIGASLKDLGKKWFAFSKMGLDADMLLQQIM